MQAVNDNAHRVSQAQSLVAAATDKARESGSAMLEVHQAIEQIDQDSRAVSGLAGQISDIASTTNLLSLNAAIEAARAGEAGRGFAVVANEVRALAARASEAAKSVDALANKQLTSVRSGTELVEKARQAVDAVVQAVNTSRDVTDALAAESVEQRGAIAEIVSAVGQMDQVTQQNAAMVEEVSASANQLADQAEELRRSARAFEVLGAHRANGLDAVSFLQRSPAPAAPRVVSAPAATPAPAPVKAKAPAAPVAKKVGAAPVPVTPAPAPTKRFESTPTEEGEWESF
jgi:methyl-accepting chemotaxis protein